MRFLFFDKLKKKSFIYLFPLQVWAGTKWEELEGPEWKKGGMVIGWNISSRQPLSIPLQYEQV